jgi:hypothetical protein
MSLLNTVFAKAEPVLLARNLKSYMQEKLAFGICNMAGVAYSDEQVVIKISALCVLLVLILDSPSLNQVNGLKKAGKRVPTTRKSRLIDTIPFPYEYIYIK